MLLLLLTWNQCGNEGIIFNNYNYYKLNFIIIIIIIIIPSFPYVPAINSVQKTIVSNNNN